MKEELNFEAKSFGGKRFRISSREGATDCWVSLSYQGFPGNEIMGAIIEVGDIRRLGIEICRHFGITIQYIPPVPQPKPKGTWVIGSVDTG